VRLRRYIEDKPTAPRHLLTVRGVGYRFVAEPEKA
jgi:DNA-binding response OmpR family regulator